MTKLSDFYKFFKVKNKNKCDQDFLGNNDISNIKKAKFCTIFFYWAKYILDPYPDVDPEPDSELFHSRIRDQIWNK